MKVSERGTFFQLMVCERGTFSVKIGYKRVSGWISGCSFDPRVEYCTVPPGQDREREEKIFPAPSAPSFSRSNSPRLVTLRYANSTYVPPPLPQKQRRLHIFEEYKYRDR